MNDSPPHTQKCSITGRELIQEPEWTNILFDDDYGTTFKIIKESILFSRPHGYVGKKSLESAMGMFLDIIRKYFHGDEGYVIIEDMTHLKGSSLEARKFFAGFLKERKRLKAIIFFGASPLVSLSIRLGKRLNIVKFNIHIADTYSEAVRLADRILRKEPSPSNDSRDLGHERPDAADSTRAMADGREPGARVVGDELPGTSCPVTGLAIQNRSDWTDIDLGEGYRVTFKFIGGHILHCEPSGYAGENGMKNLFRERKKVLDQVLKPGDRFFEIRDYGKIDKKISIAARNQMTQGLMPDKNRIIGFVGYNAGVAVKLSLSVGSRLGKSPFPMYAVKDYKNAMLAALNALKKDNFTLDRLTVTTRPDWVLKTPGFTARYEIIGSHIFHGISSGFFDNEHVDLASAMYERIFDSGFMIKDPYYFVLGAEGVTGISRTARKLYVKSIKSWYKKYPFQGYIFYGTNRWLRTAINIAKPLVPFPVKTVKNLDEALNLISNNITGDFGSGLSGHESRRGQYIPPEDIDEYVDELLGFLGNINWESKGLDRNRNIQPDHPFRQVFDAISLIKGDVDELFNERKQAEEALSSEKAYLENLFENAPEGIVMSNAEHRIVRVNKEFTKIFGYTQNEAKGYHIDDLIVPLDKKSRSDAEKLNVSVSSNKTASMETVRKTRKGDPVHVSILVSPIILKDKRIGNYGIYRDISERKKFENALVENENQVRTILNSIQTGIIVVDADSHVIIDANPAAVYIIGGSKDKIVGQVCHKFLCPDRNGSCPVADLNLNLENSESLLMTSDEVEKTILKTVIPVTLRGKKCLLESFVDYTEKKKLEDQLRQSQKMEAIGTLAGGIAHDFNNVLYPIIGFTELTLDMVPDESLAKKNLAEILIAANRAKSLVEHILTFSREQDEQVKPVEVQTIVREALNLLGPSIPSTVKIDQKVDDRCRPIMADPTQIHQVIINLATNANYAMRKNGGTMGLEVKEVQTDSRLLDKYPNLKAGSYVSLSVEDTGYGMDKSVMEKIFDPYFTTKGPGEGTGMGLAMVHGIIKKYQGEIDVQSRKGEGSRFTVLLPCTEFDEKAEVKPADQTLPLGDEKILFVDDEKQIAHMSKLILERLGYEVTTRTSSLEALALFEKKPDSFDLVITDQTMPNLTGIELSKKMLEIRPNLPIILCTGFSELISEESIRSSGIREYIMKPIVMNKIAHGVRKVLDE